MIHENVDDAVRREACERVKQIVKAIKAIKIKYYLNFSKMSEKDKETYQKLEKHLEKISDEHNLNSLKVALMSEVDAKYDKKDLDDGQPGNEHDPDKIMQACYGAIDAQKEALSKGKITQALRCQEQLKRYMQVIDSLECKDMIINYKREKLAELGRSREQLEEQIKSWENKMKGMYKIVHVSKRDNAIKMVTKEEKGGESISRGVCRS